MSGQVAKPLSTSSARGLWRLHGMKPAVALALVALVVLPSPTIRAQQKELAYRVGFTWLDASGEIRTVQELAEILEENSTWYLSEGAEGKQAQLSRARLGGINLAEMGGILSGAMLNQALLGRVNLSGAILANTDLRGSSLREADLSGARLMGTQLDGADLSGANLREAIFEPASLPHATDMARAVNLELVTYFDPIPLREMRAVFKERGFREAERKLTYALHRKETESLGYRCRGGQPRITEFSRAATCGQYLVNRVAFDLTSQYGMSPGRPLAIIAALWLVFAVTYMLFIHLPGSSGLYLVVRRGSGREQTQGIRITRRAMDARRGWRYPFRWLRAEWRLFRAAMMFSTMSAFNLGFRELDFGRWIRLLMKREYDIRPVGWVRTASGVQSLVSLYLIALWLLTSFGRPFE